MSRSMETTRAEGHSNVRKQPPRRASTTAGWPFAPLLGHTMARPAGVSSQWVTPATYAPSWPAVHVIVFRSTDEGQRNRELVAFITPRVIRREDGDEVQMAPGDQALLDRLRKNLGASPEERSAPDEAEE